MDKNTWIGFGLIALIFIGFSYFNRPSEKELEARRHYRDSVAYVRQMEREAEELSRQLAEQQEAKTELDSARTSDIFGAFAPAAVGEETFTTIENAVMRVQITNKGGRIYSAELLNYKSYGDTVNALSLFKGDESQLGFTLVTLNNRVLNTQNLYFEPLPVEVTEDGIRQVMRLKTNTDAYLDFIYTLPHESYMMDFDMHAHGMQNVLAQNVNYLEMQWNQLIPQHERGRKFEERYAQLQYKFAGGNDIAKLSESKNDREQITGRLHWIAYKDQFFSTVLIADQTITSATLDSRMMQAHTGYIKGYSAKASIEFDPTGKQTTAMHWYLGPNHYNTLKAYDNGREKSEKLYLKTLVPLGWKIVAWINMWLVIPMFDLFTSWGIHIGLIIILMTLVIKLIILPFTFQSYRSSAKMRVLKPQMDAINEKYPPEKMQERQQATMALYQKAGVSPMSGCLPLLFQMPVIMAMFWFFPTAIELRGQSFLWAEDLSTYDAILSWDTYIPIISWAFDNHLSLFCLLMTITNFIYTYLNMQTQGGGAEMKVMKWMMYLMPFMFFFIFNNYAAGLSYYYFVSLLMTILQTYIFRWSINDEKLLKQMNERAAKQGNKPKKSGFMARLEKMQREQQQYIRDQSKQRSKR